MKIAIVGPGAIGSTFAYCLSRFGHEVTVVARGKRLEWLEQEHAIVRGDGDRATVAVSPALDEQVAWDGVVVTVLAPQVSAVLPALRACAARRVIFMFNTFESLDPLRDAVGAERFAFGFPTGVFGTLVDGRVQTKVRAGTVAGDAWWAKLFTEVGIPTTVEPEMQGWLRTHAAAIAPLMALGTVAFARHAGATWREAAAHAAAYRAGFDVVRAVGNKPRPASLAFLARLPRFMLTGLLWTLSRTQLVRELGALGTAEPRMLIDMMSAAAPQLADPLRAIRPGPSTST